MTYPLLQTKLHRPPLPTRFVRRPALAQRLNEGLEAGRGTTLVSAPAGFGKTTCISEWIQNLNRPTAWLSLDSSDDDPGRFFLYLIAAFQTIIPHMAQDIEAVIRSGKIPPNEIISAALINGILEREVPFLLVMDDFHTIQDGGILDVIQTLLIHLPPSLHLVLITREDPPLPLARLRAGNRLTEIRAKELRFTAPDIAAFFQTVVGRLLTSRDVDILEQKTEGWAAGLQLAGLTIKDRQNPSDFIAGLSGNHQMILSYLTEQVLHQVPEDIRKFLMDTAILDRFSGDLCSTVTGRPDSQNLLEHFLKANVFLVPLDDENQWYRYHPFFSDLLRDLQKKGDAERFKVLHRRASLWFAGANRPDEAVHHALAAEDFRAAIELLEKHALTLLMQGHAKTVDRWLQAIPGALRSSSLKLHLAFAWAYLLQGDYSRLSKHVERWDVQSFWAEDPGLRAEWLVIRSLVLFMWGEFATCQSLAEEVLACTPDADHRILGLAYYVLGHVRLLNADHAKAQRLFVKSVQHSREAHSLVPEIMGTISLIGSEVERGKLHTSFELARQAIRRLEEADELPPMSAFIYLALGDIHYLWNQTEEGLAAARRAFQLSSLGGLNTGLVFCRILFSRFYQQKGNLHSAAPAIQDAHENLPLEAPGYIRQDITSQRVRVYLDMGQSDAAESALNEQGISLHDLNDRGDLFSGPENPYSLGMLYNCSLRTLLHQYSNRKSLNMGLAFADRLISAADGRGQFLVSLEARLLRAQYHHRLGNWQAVRQDAIDALAAGQPERLVGLITSLGAETVELIQTVYEQQALPADERQFAKEILAAFSQQRDPARETEPLIEPLTARELDVLAGMAEGLKYKEIASKLFISLNTVRFHVKAIYGKLDANNRTQALEKARHHELI